MYNRSAVAAAALVVGHAPRIRIGLRFMIGAADMHACIQCHILYRRTDLTLTSN